MASEPAKKRPGPVAGVRVGGVWYLRLACSTPHCNTQTLLRRSQLLKFSDDDLEVPAHSMVTGAMVRCPHCQREGLYRVKARHKACTCDGGGWGPGGVTPLRMGHGLLECVCHRANRLTDTVHPGCDCPICAELRRSADARGLT